MARLMFVVDDPAARDCRAEVEVGIGLDELACEACHGRFELDQIALRRKQVCLRRPCLRAVICRRDRLICRGDDPRRATAGNAEQRRKAVPIMRLSRRQNEARRTSLGIASGVKPGGEAAARPAKRLGFLKSLFMPTAQ